MQYIVISLSLVRPNCSEILDFRYKKNGFESKPLYRLGLCAIQYKVSVCIRVNTDFNSKQRKKDAALGLHIHNDGLLGLTVEEKVQISMCQKGYTYISDK